MSKRNLESAKQTQLQPAKTRKRLPYRQPEVYSLGFLEQVQSHNIGADYDGPDELYYYN